MEDPQITFYYATGSGYCHGVQLALEAAKIKYTSYEILLGEKKQPWFVAKVNPAGSVPAITYGGPVVPADQPSESSFKLWESLVLLEFVADIRPDSGLLPKDPASRASIRFFIHKIAEKFYPGFYKAFFHHGSLEEFMDILKELQDLLPRTEGGSFAWGEQFTLADASFLPFLARFEGLSKHDLGSFPEGEGRKVYERFMTSADFARLRSYLAFGKECKFFKETYDEEYLISYVTPKLAALRQA